MRDILELCVRLDTIAKDTYAHVAETCEDPAISDLMTKLSGEEAAHVVWWTELIDAWDAGLLPDIFADGDNVRARMNETLADISAALPVAGTDIRTAEQALTLAVSLEFYMLDPVFAELIDLTGPGVATLRQDSYSQHVARLVAAIESSYADKSIAGFMARALRRAWRDNRQLAVYATRDPLTSLANRRALVQNLRQWTAWSSRYGRPLTLVFLDLDGLKAINDDYGHATGDTVLAAIGNVLAGIVRQSDMAARYGGDEFAVVAPETSFEEARQLQDRIVAAVHDLGIPVDRATTLHPTVSVGAVVVVDPVDSEPRSVDELFAAADRGMYAAKLSGRDRASDPVVLASPLPL
jgi:diguanylate cyclase (GGDEF)-like protein